MSSFLTKQATNSVSEADIAVPDTTELNKILGMHKIETKKSGEEDFATELQKMRGEVLIKKTSFADKMKSQLAELRAPPKSHKNSVKDMLTGDSF